MNFKKIILAITMLTVLSMPVAAQDSDRSMSVSVSPIVTIFGSADLLYQLKLTNYMSLTVPFVFSYFWPMENLINLANKENQKSVVTISKAPITIKGGLGTRFTPFSQVMHDSFYLEPRINLAYSQFEADFTDSGKLSLSSIKLNPMLMLGWDWYWESGFLASLGGGIGYAFNLKNQSDIPPKLAEAMKSVGGAVPNFSSKSEGNLAWDLEFKLGYAW